MKIIETNEYCVQGFAFASTLLSDLGKRIGMYLESDSGGDEEVGAKVEVGGLNVGKSTLRGDGAAVCLYRASNCISSGYECDRIFLSSRALLGYTMTIFSLWLRSATGGSVVVVEAAGPDTTWRYTLYVTRIFVIRKYSRCNRKPSLYVLLYVFTHEAVSLYFHYAVG